MLFVTTLLAITASPLPALPKFGTRTQAAWLSETTGYEPGKPLVTALRLTLARGWHTYWINPGEAGMPLSAKFELPEGWTAESPQYPFPTRFKTGELHDFGYSGTVWFPVVLHPPAHADGEVELSGTFSWLTCDDTACVPGEATLKLRLSKGIAERSPSANSMERAMKRIPVEAPEGWKLEVTGQGDALELKLSLPSSIPIADLDVFPQSLNVIDPSATFAWRSEGDYAVTTVPKSTFAAKPPDTLDIVINHPSLERPIRLGWSQKS